MKRPLVSFIIPLYNCEKYIERCINSILSAEVDRKLFEIIVVDDGSRDGGYMICDSMRTDGYELRLIRQKNQGASAARNAGLELAKGDYIWFVDGDDYVSTTGVCDIFDYIQQFRPEVICFNYDEETSEGIRTNTLYHELEKWESLEFLSHHRGLYLWNKVYSRSLIGDHRFLHGTKNIEDFLFNIEVLANAACVECLPLNGYVYVTTNMSSTSRNLSCRNLVKLSQDSLTVHRKIHELIGDTTDVRARKALAKILNFSIGGHIFSLLKFYNLSYLLKAVRTYRSDRLFPVGTTGNAKMNLFVGVMNPVLFMAYTVSGLFSKKHERDAVNGK